MGNHTCNHKLKLKKEHERANLWEILTELAHSEKLLGGYNRERSKQFIKLSKINLRSLTGFLSGHCRLRGHLKRMRKRLLNTCFVNVMDKLVG